MIKLNFNLGFWKCVKYILTGRRPTNQDLLDHRLGVCREASVGREEVSNFWVGIEDLKPQPPDIPDVTHFD